MVTEIVNLRARPSRGLCIVFTSASASLHPSFQIDTSQLNDGATPAMD